MPNPKNQYDAQSRKRVGINMKKGPKPAQAEVHVRENSMNQGSVIVGVATYEVLTSVTICGKSFARPKP